MKFFTGDTNSKLLRAKFNAWGWGRVLVDRVVELGENEDWIFDNGAYGDYKHGRDFDEVRYRKMLDKVCNLPTPYFAVVPDKLGAGRESLEFSVSWRQRLPDTWKWYLVLQDGMTSPEIPLEMFDGLFLGGTNRFKREAEKWSDFARKNGLPFHYGRAGTPYKIGHAIRSQADSCDSAFPLWKHKRMDEIVTALNEPWRAFSLGPLFAD